MNKKVIYLLLLVSCLVIGFSAASMVCFADEPDSINSTTKVEVTKGVVNASKLIVRSNPGTNYSVVGQLAKDDQVSILQQKGDWYEIESNGLIGWIHGGYIKELSREEKIVYPEQQVSRGTYSTRGEIKEVSLKGSSKLGESIVAEARKHLGKPYRHGAAGPNAFDCSGLVYYCYSSIGVTVPRSSKDYGSAGVGVSLNEAVAGDIVCFNINGRGISHVGIYIGNGEFIHAASGSKTHKVMVSSLSDDYFSKRFVGLRRLL